ncbi:hypothetical protein CsSME_00051602 [Camellia sinensis var. sinensis]
MGSRAGSFLKVVANNFDVLARYLSLSLYLLYPNSIDTETVGQKSISMPFSLVLCFAAMLLFSFCFLKYEFSTLYSNQP